MSSKQAPAVIEHIYVTLDVLLDTRMGTLARMGKELAANVLEQGYHTRQDDNFPGVDIQQYKQMYAERDVTTLAHSTVTDGIKLVKHLVGVLTEQAIKRPYHDGVKIVVNIYPYKLTGEEKEQIGRAIAAWINGLAPVELVEIQPKDLTPKHCKSSYAMMIVYDYEEWMNLHAEAFEQTRLPEVTMFVPAIYFSKTPTAEELDQIRKEAAHPMRAIEMLASPLIELTLIDVKFFSVLSMK